MTKIYLIRRLKEISISEKKYEKGTKFSPRTTKLQFVGDSGVI